MVSLMSRLQNPDSAKTWLTTESSRAATRELETGGSSAHAATVELLLRSAAPRHIGTAVSRPPSNWPDPHLCGHAMPSTALAASVTAPRRADLAPLHL
ncbi:Os10g0448200 [Oryza sativa Japonica Group]|uniref:Os10g0448200 protein n=1 Tax=Oryza sativa subsp. japonica TaxID=39947 RepID=A0A0N7KRV7_ORYSJ|nr:Os10g0448200 [Oryza sativa Japonica Group]